MKQISFLICAVFLLSASSPAKAGLLEFFFPSLKKEEYNPYKTLKAPFAKDPETAEPIENRDDTPLNIQHRTDNEIGRWIMSSLPEIMTMDAATYRQDLRDAEMYFDDTGLAAYRDFLTQQKINAILESGQYNVHVVVSDVPVLLNEGNVGGRYRWLFEVPVMVSYLKKNMKGYKKSDAVNQFFSVQLQVGRTRDAKNEHHVLIETWAGKDLRKKK